MRVGRVAVILGMSVVVAGALLAGFGLLRWAWTELASRLDDVGADAGDPPGQVGVAWERGLLSPAGDRLAVRFPGVVAGGDEPCGAFYVGLVGATLEGLRVTVITIPGPQPARPAGGTGSPACPASPAARCAEVRLPYPPDGRRLYDGVGGGVPTVATATGDDPLCDQLLAG